MYHMHAVLFHDHFTNRSRRYGSGTKFLQLLACRKYHDIFWLAVQHSEPSHDDSHRDGSKHRRPRESKLRLVHNRFTRGWGNLFVKRGRGISFSTSEVAIRSCHDMVMNYHHLCIIPSNLPVIWICISGGGLNVTIFWFLQSRVRQVWYASHEVNSKHTIRTKWMNKRYFDMYIQSIPCRTIF